MTTIKHQIQNVNENEPLSDENKGSLVYLEMIITYGQNDRGFTTNSFSVLNILYVSN